MSYLYKGLPNYTEFLEVRAEDFNPLMRRMTDKDRDTIVKKALQRLHPNSNISMVKGIGGVNHGWLVEGDVNIHLVILDHSRTINDLRLNMIKHNLLEEYIPIVNISEDEPELNKDMYDEEAPH